MVTLRERLDVFEGQPEQRWIERRCLSVGEKGQSYHVTFSSALMSAVYAVDGGIIKDNHVLKCDKLILGAIKETKWLELFVELKGRDIAHAIEQVEATIRNSLFNDVNIGMRHARIVGRSIPRSTGNSVTEIAKKRFIRQYNCRLELKTGPAKEILKIS